MPTRLHLLLAAAAFALLPHATARAATGTHLDGSTLYPRLLRLQHARHGLNGTILAKTGNKLFRSSDDGHTFTYFTTVPTTTDHSADEPAAPSTAATVTPRLTTDTERCCSTLYELPRRIGKLRAGTLLYAASFFSGPTPSIDLFSSGDDGRHWVFLAQPMRAGDAKHGLWEPAFTVAHDGSLVMFVSDETDACCSQKLVQLRSHDGKVWSAKSDTVAATNPRDRPGMAIVSEIPGGRFLMTYELCGPTAHCQVFFRTSTDGWNFGSPASLGTRITSTTGQYFAHAPTNLYVPRSGQTLVIGQVLYEATGSVSPQNGKVILSNRAADGSGPWQITAAPVEVPAAYDNYCPNYSSALLSTDQSSALLEFASDYNAPHHCTTYFAIAPLAGAVSQSSR